MATDARLPPREGATQISSLRRSLSTVAVSVGLLVGVLVFLRIANQTYPIRHWLFWVYAKIWLATLAFAAACVCAGNAVIVRVLRRTLPLVEQVALAFAVGVFVFFLMVFGAGVSGWLRPPLFFLGPLAVAAPGLRLTVRLARRACVHLRAWRARARPTLSFGSTVVLIAGCAGLALIYFELLTPENVAYDARWYHLPIAEHYAAAGAIRPFPEGWFFGAYPHLASYLYTWAMLLPGGSYFEKVELCAHLEFVIFLATLLGTTALVRHLLPGRRSLLAWVAIFLFPEIFIYDSSLTVGADHVAALWAPPILMLFFRTVRAPSPRTGALLGVVLAGAFCTKATAIFVVAFPALAIVAWCLWGAIRARDRSERNARLSVLLATALVGAACGAPHWLKNWVWYGDPLYPMLRNLLGAHPTTPDFAIPLDHWFFPPDFHPARTWRGLRETLGALLTYSFVPRDWYPFHRDVPLFGSLSTLALLYLPFLRGTRRIWLTYAAIHLGIFLWFSLHHFDRYLQVLLPWMVAALAASFQLVWSRGWLARAPLVLAVAVQVVWGGDTYFFAQHAMTGSAVKKSIDLLEAGFEQNFERRFTTAFGRAPEIGGRLGAADKVLIHEQHGHWALQRMSVSDWQGTQAGISYVRTGNLRGVHELLERMGVTHLLFNTAKSEGYDTLGSDLLFFTYAKFSAIGHETFDGQTLAKMPAVVDKEMATDRVAFFGCADTYGSGLYRLADLTAADLDPRHLYPAPLLPFPSRQSDAEVEDVLTRASFAVVDAGCRSELLARPVQAGLVEIARRHQLELYARPPVATGAVRVLSDTH